MSRILGKPDDVILDRIANIFCEVPNWTEANLVSELVAIPNIPNLGFYRIDRILEAVSAGKADLRGSFGFRKFIEKLYEESGIGTSVVNELLLKRDLNVYMREGQVEG
ncbi:hypothetical protein [Sphingomonas kyeonggiensis]|uniref:Uncharacterized protein n=1 Tax=Sphingomonas kyeonggiensis TaxID=1268553 RepID=A0A7W6NWY9_9SPHN|nr:hypothetical protein [Sphingomonas kyeonggiensis]MBB4099619.1 hypothetical protein [Sphingomonas kyeonggiensis]